MKTKKREFGVSFGLIADPLSKQLKEQGLKLSASRMRIYEEYRKAIGNLNFVGILSDSEMKRAADRYLKKLVAAIKKERTK